MKNQTLFSSKDKSKKLKCLLLQFLFGSLGVKAGCKEKGKSRCFPSLLQLDLDVIDVNILLVSILTTSITMFICL